MSNIDIRNLNLPQISVGTDDTTVATSTPTTIVGTPQPTIQNPFAVGYVAASTSVDLPNGTSLKLPNLTQDDLQQVNALFGGMNPTQLDNVNKASQRLAKALLSAAAQTLASTTSSAVVGTGGGGTASAGGASQTNAATDTASQRVDSLTSSFYQTMAQSQMNVQPEDGDNDDEDDDGDDDDTNSWGITGNVPQMQNVQNLAATPALELTQATPQVSASTASVAAAGQNKTVATTADLQAKSLALPQSAVSTSSVAAAYATSSAAATSVAGTAPNLLSSLNVSAQATQAAGSSGIATTQNKLLSPSSPTQAPQVSSGTPEVYSAAANAVSAYQQGTAAAGGTGSATSSGSLDYDGAVNAVTYMGIIGLQQQLGNYAQTTQNQLNQLNQARTEYEDINTLVGNWPAGQQTQHFDWTMYDSNGQATSHSADLTYNQATTLKDTLSDQVNGMSDTNQTQQLQLQSLTQSYSEAINTMSNLLKMNFDTVKAVINNIRA